MVFKLRSRDLVKIVFGVLLSLFLINCNSSDRPNAKKKTKVSLQQEWFPYAGYAGEVFALYQTANEFGLELELKAGSDNLDPIKLVLSGDSDFGVVSADRILTANEKGADLVAIGVINYQSPTCFITKKGSGIDSPKDFEGHRVGILTGTNTEYVYELLKIKENIDDERLREVEIPFDLNTFINGEYDVRPAFIYDETVSLDRSNVEYSVIEPKDYSIDFLGTVYFTSRSFLESNPKTVERFVYTLAKGWESALSDPEKAIHFLKKYDSSIDVTRELKSLERGRDYFSGEQGKVLYAGQSRWENMSLSLASLKGKEAYDIIESVDLSYIEKYHHK